jgi:hypothetical protein
MMVRSVIAAAGGDKGVLPDFVSGHGFSLLAPLPMKTNRKRTVGSCANEDKTKPKSKDGVSARFCAKIVVMVVPESEL